MPPASPIPTPLTPTPLTNADIVELTALRHALHRAPEVSGAEAGTARRIAEALAPLAPDTLITGLGGHGIAAVFTGAEPGPTVMARCELDALPIHELGRQPHTSATPGSGHLCGHDGHMAILTGLARRLSRQRPARGRAVLLFQPAEETGAGAQAVLDDPRFAALAPDWAFAIHNMPGIVQGAAWLAPGPANCASVGLQLSFTGETAHASTPETGRAPTRAIARLIEALDEIGPGGTMGPGFRLATVTHLRMGEPAFGIAPGAGELWVTLRGLTDADLAEMLDTVQNLARREAEAADLALSMALHDPFAACTNDRAATAVLGRALDAAGVSYDAGDLPMRASEDFGRFGTATGAKAAMVLLGAGLDTPALHSQHYDFPDTLIPPGVAILEHCIRELIG